MAIDRIERLLNIAQNGDDVELRLNAIEQLGDAQYKGNGEILNALVKIMQGNDDHVMAYKERRAALVALAEIGDTNAVKFIIYALEDDSTPVKIAAANTLGKLGAEEALTPLLAVMQDSNDEVRKAAVMALGEIGAKFPVSVEALIPMLADPDDEVRGVVRDLIEAMNRWATIGVLLTALQNTNSTIRGSVVEILGDLADERARASLQKAYEDDSSEWVRSRARWALDQLPAPEFPPPAKSRPAPPPPLDTLTLMRSNKPQWPSLSGTPLKDIDDIQREREAQQLQSTPSSATTPQEMSREQIQVMIDQLDVRLVNGEISEATYNRLVERWQERLQTLIPPPRSNNPRHD